MITRAFRPDMPAHVGAAEDSAAEDSLGAPSMNDEQGATPPGRDAARSDSRRDSYGEAIGTLFDNDQAVREALSVNLADRGTEGLRVRDGAVDAFSGFVPSRYTAEQRARPNYMAPGDDIDELLDSAVLRGLDSHRARRGRLRLNITPGLMNMLDTSDSSDEVLGHVRLADLVELVSGSAAPVPAANPAAVASAASEADRLLASVVSVEHATDGGRRETTGARSGTADSDIATDAAVAGGDNKGVAKRVEALIAEMTAPESTLRFNVEGRADREAVREEITTFELRAGPSDVTAYHDFGSLRIAFENVWTEVFDGQLADLGRQLYQEYVKLQVFAGQDPDTRSVETLDDLRRLMDEVRDLGDITLDAMPGDVRPTAAGSSDAGAVTGTTVVDAVMGALDPAGLIIGAIGDKTVQTILNPGGALIEAIANLFAGKPQLTWDSFPGPLPVAGDVISVRLEPEAVAAGTVEIVIANTPQTSWWKGIDFREFGTAGVIVSNFKISTDPRDSGVWDSDSYNRLPLYTNQLPNGVLEFQKAAPGIGVGIHTGYYLLADLPARLVDRMRVTFTWEKDS